jgi:DASH complex subunit DAD3
MAATSATTSSPIFSVNPYENHPSLTQIEADVLWEYAKLNQHIKDVRKPLQTPRHCC